MTVTHGFLLRAAAVAAAVAGLIFIGVQINHPSLDATSITTTDVMIRNSLKLVMTALALAGITGVYLFQVTRIGVLGLIGYVVFAARLPQHAGNRVRGCARAPIHRGQFNRLRE